MRAAHLLLMVLIPSGVFAHGGTSHSGDMAVDNAVTIDRAQLTIAQVHTCVGKLAADLWAATDGDSDGKLSDAELAKCIEDSRTVYQQWCRLEVDWKTILPARVDVKLASFPRTLPATFAGASALVLEHVALYPTPDAGPVRNVGLNVTSLNARVIKTRVRCEPGMKVETTSFGTLARGGAEVTDMLQQDGLPDQIALVVREDVGAPSAPRGLSGLPPPQQALLVAGLIVMMMGCWSLVARAVAYGRATATPGSSASAFPIAFAFVILGCGALMALRALMFGGVLKLSL